MSDRPGHAGVVMADVAGCRSVLIEVLTILAKDLDKIVVVGGWVPELVYPGRGHIGSLDVDLALDPFELKPMAYESIRKKLVDSGYEQTAETPNAFYRSMKGSSQKIKVDLITGEFPDRAEGGSHLSIQELRVWKAHGIDLAFQFQQDIRIEGTLPDGGHNVVSAKLPSIAAFVCIKAIALGERKKEKDAYDIAFCIDHYPGGPRALAAEFAGKLGNPLLVEGLATLRSKFARVDSIGPVWAAQVSEQVTVGTARDLELEQRRAFQLVDQLLEAIGVNGAE